MKLKDQIVELELSKQLKKADYPQDGLWWWINYQGVIRILHPDFVGIKICVAPTLAELIDKLPEWIKNDCYFLSIDKNSIEYRHHADSEKCWCACDGKFLQDALARMWLYLKKEGLI